MATLITTIRAGLAVQVDRPRVRVVAAALEVEAVRAGLVAPVDRGVLVEREGQAEALAVPVAQAVRVVRAVTVAPVAQVELVAAPAVRAEQPAPVPQVEQVGPVALPPAWEHAEARVGLAEAVPAAKDKVAWAAMAARTEATAATVALAEPQWRAPDCPAAMAAQELPEVLCPAAEAAMVAAGARAPMPRCLEAAVMAVPVVSAEPTLGGMVWSVGTVVMAPRAVTAPTAVAQVETAAPGTPAEWDLLVVRAAWGGLAEWEETTPAVRGGRVEWAATAEPAGRMTATVAAAVMAAWAE